MSKRKRNLNMRCVLFPDDVREAFRRSRTEPVRTSTPASKSWETCGDSFLDVQTSEKKPRVRKGLQTCATGIRDEAVHIAWSSSEDEELDSDNPLPPPRVTVTQTPQTSRAHKHPVDYSRCLRMLSTGVETDDLPSIDSDSDVEEETSTSKDQMDSLNAAATPAEISDCTSNDDEDPEENRTDSSLLDPAETSRQSVSEWVRSAQAILQTPKKQTARTIKTPEDSGKKRQKFERGGLAEKLSRLHGRQRSAISFWRHQSSSSLSSAVRPGVLTLRIVGVREECGMQAAVCDRLPENEKCVALFSKDTAAQLRPTPGDLVHVYPPWQNLVVEEELYPIILNTHFSQKICVETDTAACSRPAAAVEKCPPPLLTRCLWRSDTSPVSKERSELCQQTQVSVLSCLDRRKIRDSLLDAVEDCGSRGSQREPVEVLVQRVYCIPNSHSDRTSLQHRTLGKPLWHSEQAPHIGRLCALVQDGYGMFSDVLLQRVSSDSELHQSYEQLEGRVCVLQGLRVTQRLTRDRWCFLFSLIDSLWPPLVPPKCHDDLLPSPSERVSPPSFCYRLSVDQGHMVPLSGQTASPLYRPPVLQTLRELIQDESSIRCCSFRATVVHKQLRSSHAGEMLLFVTDPSLQMQPSVMGSRRTVSVHLRPSCLLWSSVTRALDLTQERPILRFRDAVKEQGHIFCVEQTVIQLEPENPSLCVPRPVILDQLCPETPPYSLCTLTGVIVAVDENTAFSWPACTRCESCRLQTAPEKQEGFQCLSCGTLMDKPTTKMQLDVFLNCPSLSQCTVKVKLQQKTIKTLLNTTRGAEGYTVESVLGMEIGPLSAVLHEVFRSHTVWMGLEEFV